MQVELSGATLPPCRETPVRIDSVCSDGIDALDIIHVYCLKLLEGACIKSSMSKSVN